MPIASAFADVDFVCNVCGQRGLFRRPHFENPELPSCLNCGSNARFRWLIHRLAIELFGRSMPLPAFPCDRSIKGIGLSDPQCIASVLAERFTYSNTSLVAEPRLDITCDTSPIGPLDFLIASEVFEHVEPPVTRAFENAGRLLKPSGILLLTVPWVWDGDPGTAIPELHDWRLETEQDGYVIANLRADGEVERFRNMAFDGLPGPSLGHTREHFPHLKDWRVSGNCLRNTRADGAKETFHNLVFHEGTGIALEMRLFTKGGIEDNLRAAGFRQIEFEFRDRADYGIIFGYPWSRPIAAHKRLTS
jgi:SAM-dependent methyltransferase